MDGAVFSLDAGGWKIGIFPSLYCFFFQVNTVRMMKKIIIPNAAEMLNIFVSVPALDLATIYHTPNPIKPIRPMLRVVQMNFPVWRIVPAFRDISFV